MKKGRNAFTLNMKASTALLLTILTAFVFCLSSYVVSVNSRYATGDYEYVNSDKSRYKRIRLSPSSVVMIDNVDDCSIIVSDSLSIEVDKADEGNFQFLLSQDTMRIMVESSPVHKVLLYLPTGSELRAKRCAIQMKGSLHHNNQPSYRVTLANSELTASGQGLHAFLNSLKITGLGNAKVNVSKYFHIQSLELNDVDKIHLAQGWQIGVLKTNFVDGSSAEMIKIRDSVSVVTVAR